MDDSTLVGIDLKRCRRKATANGGAKTSERGRVFAEDIFEARQ